MISKIDFQKNIRWVPLLAAGLMAVLTACSSSSGGGGNNPNALFGGGNGGGNAGGGVYNLADIKTDTQNLVNSATTLQQLGLKPVQMAGGQYAWDPQTQQNFLNQNPGFDRSQWIAPLQNFGAAISNYLKKYSQPYKVRLGDGSMKDGEVLSAADQAGYAAALELVNKSIADLRH